MASEFAIDDTGFCDVELKAEAAASSSVPSVMSRLPLSPLFFASGEGSPASPGRVATPRPPAFSAISLSRSLQKAFSEKALFPADGRLFGALGVFDGVDGCCEWFGVSSSDDSPLDVSGEDVAVTESTSERSS